MANQWFETVAIAQQLAKKRLPKSSYGAIVAGAEAGVTMRDNFSAFDELGFRPVTAGQPAERHMDTKIMGQPSSMPVMISPTGAQAIHDSLDKTPAAMSFLLLAPADLPGTLLLTMNGDGPVVIEQGRPSTAVSS